jgi:hypothetical protein
MYRRRASVAVREHTGTSHLSSASMGTITFAVFCIFASGFESSVSFMCGGGDFHLAYRVQLQNSRLDDVQHKRPELPNVRQTEDDKP